METPSLALTISSKKEEGKDENDQTCLNVISFERLPNCSVMAYHQKVKDLKAKLDELFSKADKEDEGQESKPSQPEETKTDS